MAAVSDRDRERARSLPDDLLSARAPAAPAMAALVQARWPAYPEAERRSLAQLLLVTLDPLTRPGGAVTGAMRLECELIVTQWLKRQVAR